MNAVVTWQDIALRLAAAVIAGAVIGFDRGARGQVAGLRTTILMCLAATGAMIEANLMLGVTGKTGSSFTMMDALRFPLGILSGIGFIGAGAIVRRDKLVTGVTTAATLWLVTVVGLILGAGFIVMGAAIVLIAFVVLDVVKRIEPLLFREHRGDIFIEYAAGGTRGDDLQKLICDQGYQITSVAVTRGERQELRCHIVWHGSEGPEHVPELIERLVAQAGVTNVDWEPLHASNQLE